LTGGEEMTSQSFAIKSYVTKMEKVTSGPQLIEFITSMLNDPHLYVFGEVVENDKIKQLAQTDDKTKQSYALLELFAYGKFSDFKAKEKDFPALSAQQLNKLHQLTIITLAKKKRQISYQSMMQELGLPTIRDVENLIISSIYEGIITGKLNSEKQQFVVEETLGRDVRPHEIDNMIASLTEWQKQSTVVLSTLEQRVQYARSEHESVNTMKQDHARQMGEIKATIKMLMEAEMENNERGGGLLGAMMGMGGMGMGGYGGMGGDYDDPRKRGHQGGKDKGKDKGGKKHGM
jgi:COP9 signalosome complex subunit 7